MKLLRHWVTTGLWLALLAGCQAASAQTLLRLAIFDLQDDETGEVGAFLRAQAKAEQSQFELLDGALVHVAAQGAGYNGSLNLYRHEARALGLSVGCDFYLLGKVWVGRRLGEGEKSYYEAWFGLFAVETRTGGLVSFVFENARAENEAAARKKLLASLTNVWRQQVQAMSAASAQHQAEIAGVDQPAMQLIEVLNDDQLGQNSQQPIFYQRLKPEYTKEAELVGVVAIVELEAVFQSDGKVGEINVTRWAGFGLDESALATVRKLRFKPASQAGKEVTIRGLVRYNFRRPSTLAERQEEAERLKRSLRDLNNPVIKSLPPRP
jgi:TonB family protein